MKLGEKIRYLREVEGSLRGLDRPMTQLEIVRAIREELGSGRGKKGQKATTISQSYLSQIENGSPPRFAQSAHALPENLFQVHPGFLADCPPGYHHELPTDLRTPE